MKTIGKKRKAFTLIELLVVISIIALLLSILLPSLRKAKRQAKKVVCQSNLKQQSYACTLYLNDYENKFPSVTVSPTNNGVNICATYHSWGGRLGRDFGSNFTPRRLLNPYVGRTGSVSTSDTELSLQVFRCPGDDGWIGGEWPTDVKPSFWEVLGYSYHFNSDANANSEDGLWNKKLFEVKNPYHCVLAADATIRAYMFGYDPHNFAYWHDEKELGWANVLFVDMHVGYIQFTYDNPDFQHGPNWTVVYDD